MVGKKDLNKMQLGLEDVIECLKQHLERAGYTITTIKRHGTGANITAAKNNETFIVESIGENKNLSADTQEKELFSLIGRLVRMMKKDEAWVFYGIAFPKHYLRFLRDFEVGGLQLLDFHVFVVEDPISLYHLNSKNTISLIQNLKAGKPQNLMLLDIDFKRYDYKI